MTRASASKARAPAVPRLMGAVEVAKAIGITSPNNLAKVAGLPKPRVTYLARGDLWLADEVKAFAKARQQRLREQERRRAKAA